MPSLTYKQIQDKNLWILDLEDIEKETSNLIVRNRINNKMFSSSKKKFVKNDVLYGKLRPYLDKVLVADEDGICTTEIVPIRIYKDILPEYLRYILKSPFFLNYVNNLTYGVKMPRLGTDDAENALLPISPLSEQKKIVNILNSTINAIENITLDKEALSNVIKQTKAKVLDLAIKGKLVPQDPNDEPADKLLEKTREEKEKLIKEGKLKRDKNETYIFKNSDDNSYYEQIDDETICIDDDLPFEIPDSWKWCRLGNIGDWGAGSTPNRNKSNYYDKGTIPWLKTGDLNDSFIDDVPEYITELALKETSVSIKPKGSVLIAMYGATIGKLGILNIESTTNQACCACKCIGINNLYLFYFLMSQRNALKEKGMGGAQPNISRELLVNYYFSLPPLNEQHRIVEKIKSIFTQLDTMQDIFHQ